MLKYRVNTQIKLLISLAGIFVALYCAQERYDIFKIDKEETGREGNVEIVIKNKENDRFAINSELAITESDRSYGLMNRPNLEKDAGMFFIFPNDSLSGFWMKDTLIPLDILFINAKGEIIYIKHNAQPCESSPCPVYNPGKVYRYVLELNGGYSKSHGIDIGDEVVLPQITSDS